MYYGKSNQKRSDKLFSREYDSALSKLTLDLREIEERANLFFLLKKILLSSLKKNSTPAGTNIDGAVRGDKIPRQQHRLFFPPTSSSPNPSPPCSSPLYSYLFYPQTASPPPKIAATLLVPFVFLFF